MDAESFFARWARRNAEASQDAPAAPPAEAGADIQPPAPPSDKPLTLDDVAQLTPESDYTPFVARGIDENVKRSALKKLFSDPQFNVMDGLDVYIDDYNKFEPIPPEMLAMLNHAKALLNPLPQFEKPLMQVAEAEPEAVEREHESEPADAAALDDENRAAAATPQEDPDALPGHAIEPISDNRADDHPI